jgi:type IV pilus assembly protein PilQ
MADAHMTQTRYILLAVLLVLLPLHAQQPGADTASQTISLDFKDVDIRDAIRAVSKQNNLNIVLDTNVTGKVTLHLTNVPVLDGLRSLAEPSGLEVVKDGRFYRIRKKLEDEKSIIRYVNDKLTIDVQNVDVRAFLQELGSKTAISIVPDPKVTGKISAKLNQVSLDDGLRAVLEGNGYQVTKHRNIYQVSLSDQSSQSGQTPPRSSQYRTSTGKADFYVDFSGGKLTIEVTNGDLEDVVKAISEQTGVQIVTYGSIKSEVNAKLYSCTVAEAFNLLLRGTRFTFVVKDSVVLIGDRNAATPSGQALSTSELIPLNHVKADAVPPVLPYNIPANNIKVIKEQNALLVSGSSDDIEMVRDFLKTIDIPTPQVRIDAVIVEYKENLDKEFGVNYWGHWIPGQGEGYKVLPSPATRYDAGSTGVEGGFTGKGLKGVLNGINLSGGLIDLIPDDFFAVIKMLESQDKARVLGQPSVLTLNGYKATINVDETQYFKITTGIAENYSLRFQPIKFGITLNITPWISQGGQIIAEISPEVSNSEKTNSDGYPNISTRSLTTTARLNNGQTLVLGGLTKNSDQEFTHKIPFLGDIPIIGSLFSHKGRTRTKTNLVVYITPHIISPLDTVNLSDEMRRYNLNSGHTIDDKIGAAIDRLRNPYAEDDSTAWSARSRGGAQTKDARTPGHGPHAGNTTGTLQDTQDTKSIYGDDSTSTGQAPQAKKAAPGASSAPQTPAARKAGQ